MAKQRITIKEVANSVGVSYQTVSKVMNHQAQVSKETEERIWQVVRELGYRPNHIARSLRSQRSYLLGYTWAPSPPDQSNPILDLFLHSMFKAAEEQSYYLLCFPYHKDPAQQLSMYEELINTGRVDGFILSGVEYNDPRILLLQERDFPFVAFGRSNPELIFPWIDIDGGAGIAMAVNHLLQSGFKRIAALAWHETSRVGNNRMEGYFDALHNAGISPNPEWILRGEGRFDFGYKAAMELLDLPSTERPNAIIALNDLMAIGAMQAVRERGLEVGTEFAITGFDDGPMVQYLYPPLTTVRQPVWEIGQQIISMMLEYLESGKPPAPNEILVMPQLIVRASSGNKNQALIYQSGLQGGEQKTKV